MTSPNGSGHGNVNDFTLVADDVIPGISPYTFAFMFDGFEVQEHAECVAIARQLYEGWREEYPIRELSVSARLFAYRCWSQQRGCSNDTGRLPSELRNTLFGYDAISGLDETFAQQKFADKQAQYNIVPSCKVIVPNSRGKKGYAFGGLVISLAYPQDSTALELFLHEWSHVLLSNGTVVLRSR
jgi:hypothetical protein